MKINSEGTHLINRKLFLRHLITLTCLLLIFIVSSCINSNQPTSDNLTTEAQEANTPSQGQDTQLPQFTNTISPTSTVEDLWNTDTPTLLISTSTPEVIADSPSTPQTNDLIVALQKKSLGYNLSGETFDLWEYTAMGDDLAKVGPRGYAAAENLTRGYIVVQYPPDDSSEAGPSEPLLSKAQAITAAESLEPNQILDEANWVHKTGKQFVVAPTGARLLRWDEDTLSTIAQNSDVFIIQAQRWLVEDKSPYKEDFVSKVLMFSQIIRKANSNCKIFVEIGRRVDRGGGTAQEWIEALGYLYAADPNSFDGIYLFVTLQPAGSNQGLGALEDMVALLRP